jgi:hypothetical protein
MTPRLPVAAGTARRSPQRPAPRPARKAGTRKINHSITQIGRPCWSTDPIRCPSYRSIKLLSSYR